MSMTYEEIVTFVRESISKGDSHSREGIEKQAREIASKWEDDIEKATSDMFYEGYQI